MKKNNWVPSDFSETASRRDPPYQQAFNVNTKKKHFTILRKDGQRINLSKVVTHNQHFHNFVGLIRSFSKCYCWLPVPYKTLLCIQVGTVATLCAGQTTLPMASAAAELLPTNLPQPNIV